jgi:hypothetical protein
MIAANVLAMFPLPRRLFASPSSLSFAHDAQQLPCLIEHMSFFHGDTKMPAAGAVLSPI